MCEHEYVAFPNSRRLLYCRWCGAGRDAFAGSAEKANPRRAGARNAAARRRVTHEPETIDPDVEAARDVLFRKKVDRLVDEAGLESDEAERMRSEGYGFGPSLDLDQFAAMLEEMGRARAQSAVTEDALSI